MTGAPAASWLGQSDLRKGAHPLTRIKVEALQVASMQPWYPPQGVRSSLLFCVCLAP